MTKSSAKLHWGLRSHFGSSESILAETVGSGWACRLALLSVESVAPYKRCKQNMLHVTTATDVSKAPALADKWRAGPPERKAWMWYNWHCWGRSEIMAMALHFGGVDYEFIPFTNAEEKYLYANGCDVFSMQIDGKVMTNWLESILRKLKNCSCPILLTDLNDGMGVQTLVDQSGFHNVETNAVHVAARRKGSQGVQASN